MRITLTATEYNLLKMLLEQAQHGLFSAEEKRVTSILLRRLQDHQRTHNIRGEILQNKST